MNNIWCVYKHTFPNNKSYIGIAAGKPEYRWGPSGSGYKEQPLISRAILKYGWDNIKHEILFSNLTQAEAKEKEIELIKIYKTYYTDGNGYNMTRGGDGQAKLNIDQAEKLWNDNKSCSEIGRILGHDRHCIIRALNALGYDTSVPKKIYQYDTKGNFIKEYKTITEASNATGCDGSSISKCASGKRQTAGGFKWSYEKEGE